VLFSIRTVNFVAMPSSAAETPATLNIKPADIPINFVTMISLLVSFCFANSR
jgi:hypothetical protein